MANNLKEEYRSIRGFFDILPTASEEWDYIENIILNLMPKYGYEQIRLPLLEKTALFKRAIGEVTDIVEKEMFTFLDEKKRSLSLRPEGTAGCVRACIEHGLLRQLPKKLWYQGPMFRYEAPQKGRNRQFHQIGLECLGVSSCEAELEQIIILSKLWESLGLKDVIKLEINNLGSPKARNTYIKDLVTFLQKYYDQLDVDCQRRLKTNPLRILDSKNPIVKQILLEAPKLFNYLDKDSLDNYDSLKSQLFLLGINYQENYNIVRGLDYYTGTVWEWTSNLLGAQSAVGAGGRYDCLVEQLSNLPVQAVGLAIGMERVILLMQHKLVNTDKSVLTGYLICVGEKAIRQKLIIAEKIRSLCNNLNLVVDLLGGSVKNQFKRADKSKATLALILGDDEINDDSITIKYLRDNGAAILKSEELNKQQITVKVADLYKYIL